MIMIQWSSWSDRGDPVRSRCPDYDRIMWKTGVINEGMKDCRVIGEDDSLSRWAKEGSTNEVTSTLSLESSTGVWWVKKSGEEHPRQITDKEAWPGRTRSQEAWDVGSKSVSPGRPHSVGITREGPQRHIRKKSLFSMQWSRWSSLSKERMGANFSEHNQRGVKDRQVHNLSV